MPSVNPNKGGKSMRYNVQAYVYVKSLNKLLLLKRTEERSGYWQPVCGGIESGEELLSAAKREVLEETAIDTYEALEIFEGEYRYKESKRGIEMDMLDRFVVMTIKDICPIQISDEHDRYIWCDLEEVKDYTDWPPILEMVDRISRMDKK